MVASLFYHDENVIEVDERFPIENLNDKFQSPLYKGKVLKQISDFENAPKNVTN